MAADTRNSTNSHVVNLTIWDFAKNRGLLSEDENLDLRSSHRLVVQHPRIGNLVDGRTRE